MKMYQLLAVIGVVATVATPAAALVDFNAHVGNTQFFDGYVVTGGFNFTTTGLLGVWSSAPSSNFGPAVFNNSPYLIAGFGGLVIEATNGAAFQLNGWDLALGWFQPDASRQITVTFDLAAGGQAVQVLDLSTDSFRSTSLGQAVHRITLSSGAGGAMSQGYISLDNVDVTPVPEPGSLALMFGGLALLGAGAAVQRRHRR